MKETRVLAVISGLLLWLGVAIGAYAQNNAQFISQSVPASMAPGQVYAVSVTMKNTGSTTWTTGGNYNLGSQNPQDNLTWGLGRVALAGPVAPGANATFNFNVTAPATPGVRNFQWKMVQDGVEWFGALTTNVAVSVSSTDNAAFVSQSVPASMAPGQVYAVSVTMQNTGNTTWSAANGYFLHSQNPLGNTTWGLSQVVMPNNVAPGQSVTFSFNATAPSTPGVYNFQWKMLRQNVAWFGALTTNVAVNVASNVPPVVTLISPANNSTFSAPANITLTATASDSDGSIQKVEFFHGGTNPIATVTTDPYTFNWTNVQAGTYALTAKATDNLEIVTESTPVNITVFGPAATGFYFIHSDHLNTPRLITNNVGQAVWRWDQADPFGGDVPNENPSGLGTYTCNLRFPGQYFDKETNTHYNYYRDYDPATGRFPQSDPIGLLGGINTYVYTNNPLGEIDPFGLMGNAPGTYGRGGSSGPSNTTVPVATTPAPYCSGQWLRVNWTRDPFFIITLNCTCYWSCYSCPGGPGDIFPSPNPGQYQTKGKVIFTGKPGKDFNPKKGDDCLCGKPGEEKGCGPC